MSDEPRKTFMVRCKIFFGLKEGQSLREFSAEIKQLTAKDRTELTELFNAAGMPTI